MSSGKEDTGFVIILSESGKYSNGVTLTVDNQQNYEIGKVYKQKMQRKAQVIKVSTGKHNLKVTNGGKTLFEKDVIVDLQETEKIVLP
jgi:hypothetical protein